MKLKEEKLNEITGGGIIKTAIVLGAVLFIKGVIYGLTNFVWCKS